MTHSTDEIKEHLDLQRWLINNNFINDLHKDNIFMYGALLHKEVKAVELSIAVETKTVHYTLYMPLKVLKKVDKMSRLSVSHSIIGLWRYKRMLKKEGSLNFTLMASRFIKDYLGPQWSAKVDIKDVSYYDSAQSNKLQGSVAD